MKMSKSAKIGKSGGKPAKNQAKKNLYILVTVVITALLITWVYSMGRKAEETVTVTMTSRSIYKNQAITEDMLQAYDMLKGEFEKFAITQSDGTKQRRILLWSEHSMIVGAFAAYPIQANDLCEYRDFVKSRVDNTDSVLYSFPGKEIVPLTIGTAELTAFKTFLEPGDRVNIRGLFTQEDEYTDPITGEKKKVETFKDEAVFSDIMMADLLNSSGESILDIYASYKDMSVYDQVQMESSSDFKTRTEPSTLLLALTPEELTRYYYYMTKGNIEFKMSLPQRVE